MPSVRGPEQSRPPEHIAAEVRQLADEGCKEITLLGQTVNSYRYDNGDGRTTPRRPAAPASTTRPASSASSSSPTSRKDMSDDLLDAVRDLPKVCPYLHVPAQSGCNDVLKRMKRLYTVEYYRDMLHRCRERVPGVAISSDFIVGFCGETEESFQKTCDLVPESGFKNSFIFKYSARPGTKADDLYPDDVPEEVKKRRNNDLLAIQGKVSLADHRRQIGQTVEVLVEGRARRRWILASRKRQRPVPIPQLTGRTMTDHIVVFDGTDRLIGQTVQVHIDEATAFTLFGTVVTVEVVGVESEAACGLAAATRIGLPLV